MNKKYFYIAAAVAILCGAIAVVIWTGPKEQLANTADYKNAEYMINGQRVKFVNGVSETEVVPGSASKVVTRYFGNELKIDLNDDGREDVVFLLTQETGGSGIFYYAVAALNTSDGYVGSDGYLLGDRIAPQTTEISQNPNQKHVIIVNYADRNPGEPMTTQPSVGKSVYLKLDTQTMQWGIVASDFEGESSSGIKGVAMLGPTCPVMRDPPDPQCADKPYKVTLSVTTADQARVIKTFSTDERGRFTVELPSGEYSIRSAAAANILPYCQHDRFTVEANKVTEITVSCDTGIR